MTERRPYRSALRQQAAADTRRRILDAAAAALFGAPFADFTLTGVARDAGVTTQTVRDQFGSKEGLLEALADVLSEQLGSQRSTAPAGDVAAALDVLLDQYEAYGRSAARLLASAEHSPALAVMAARGRAEHRAWIEDVFADRLPAGDARARERAVAALYAATDVGTWRLLRLDLAHSREDTAAVVRDLVDAAVPPRHRTPPDRQTP